MISHCYFCPYVLAQDRLRDQVMENLEFRNDGTDLGDSRDEEIWERVSQRENLPEKGETSVIYFAASKMVPACFRF